MYPKHLTRDLPSVEGKLISCLAKDISLFQEFPESITIDNFTSEENRIFFKVYKTLYEKKYSTIDEVSINSEFPQGSKDRQLFESYHGSAMTKEFKNNELSAIENFDKFKGDFLEVNSKMALYKELKSSIDRFNIEEFCNETTEHIYSYIDHKLTNSVISVNSEADIENLGIDDEFIERCKKGEAVGITYGMKEYNKLTMGMHLGNFSLLSLPTNGGKAQPLHSKVLTENGFKNMGDIKIGDKVFDKDGKLCNVTGIFPQGVRDNYRVTFKDGSTVECCDEHLWTVNTKNKKPDFTVSLKDIINNGYVKIGSKGERNFVYHTPVNKPLEYKNKDLLIHPYILGCLIGDGYIKNGISLSNSEHDLMNRVREFLPNGYSMNEDNGYNYAHSIIYNDSKKNPMIDELKNLGIYKCGSHEKFIPSEYKDSFIEQRMELLKGLFDTDGSVDKTCGNKNITTTSIRLRDDIIELCRSLGIRATYITDNRDYKYGKCYKIHIWTYEEIFTTEKHKSRVPQNRKVRRIVDYLAITNIEKIGSEEMQCIMVDSDSHTYITDNYIVTHNTTIMSDLFVFDLAMQGEDCFIYSNETAKEDFQALLLVNVLSKKYGVNKVTKNKLKSGKLTEEQWEQIAIAQEFINEHIKPHITIKYPKSHNMKEFISYMRRYAYRGVKYFFLDTMKSDDAGNAQSVGLLVDQSRTIYETCKKLNVHCLGTSQIALRHIENFTRVISESHLAGSKQIAEVCDVIITGRDLYLDELDGEKNEIKVWRNVTDDNGATWRKEYQKLDREKKYVLFNLPKNRYGEKTVFTIYERLGHLGQFHQIGLAKLKAI